MSPSFGSLVFTPVVKSLQERYGSRRQYARLEESEPSPGKLGPQELEFIGERDTFYMASIGATGWPYVQHRGGPKGFLKVIDESTLAFRRFPREQAIHQHRQSDDGRPGSNHFAGLPPANQVETPGPRRNIRRRASERLDQESSRLRLQGRHRTGICNSGRGLRLELPAAHYSALYGGRDSRGASARREANAGVGRRKREITEDLSRVVQKN